MTDAQMNPDTTATQLAGSTAGTQVQESRASYYLNSQQKLEAALKFHIEEASKFVQLKEEDRTPQLARDYAGNVRAIADCWAALPRKRRRELNKDRFSNRYKKWLNFKTIAGDGFKA